MQFEGRINKLFPVQTGTSQRGEWSRQDFIFEYFETPNDRYADRVLLSVMNDRIKEYDLHEGDTVICGFSHTTREYQGRYFNDVRLYHFEKVVRKDATAAAQPQPTVAQPQQPAPQPAQPFPPQQKDDGELPF